MFTFERKEERICFYLFDFFLLPFLFSVYFERTKETNCFVLTFLLSVHIYACTSSFVVSPGVVFA